MSKEETSGSEAQGREALSSLSRNFPLHRMERIKSLAYRSTMRVSDNWGKIPSTWQESNKLGQLLVVNQRALPELCSYFIDGQSETQGGRQEYQIQWWELKPEPTSLATDASFPSLCRAGLPPRPPLSLLLSLSLSLSFPKLGTLSRHT